MRTLTMEEACDVSGSEASIGNCIAAVGLGIAVATAPAWGAVAALIGLVALAAHTLE